MEVQQTLGKITLTVQYETAEYRQKTIQLIKNRIAEKQITDYLHHGERNFAALALIKTTSCIWTNA